MLHLEAAAIALDGMRADAAAAQIEAGRAVLDENAPPPSRFAFSWLLAAGYLWQSFDDHSRAVPVLFRRAEAPSRGSFRGPRSRHGARVLAASRRFRGPSRTSEAEIAAYDGAVATDRSLGPAWIGLSEARRRAGDRTGALEALDRAFAPEGRPPRLNVWADYHLGRGRAFVEAFATLRAEVSGQRSGLAER